MPSLCETIEIVDDEVLIDKGKIVETAGEELPSQISSAHTPESTPVTSTTDGKNPTTTGAKRKITPIADEKSPTTMDEKTNNNKGSKSASRKRSKLSDSTNNDKTNSTNANNNTHQRQQLTLNSFFTKRSGPPKPKLGTTGSNNNNKNNKSNAGKAKANTSTAASATIAKNQPKGQKQQKTTTKEVKKKGTTQKKDKAGTTTTKTKASSAKTTAKKKVSKSKASSSLAKKLQKQELRETVVGRAQTLKELSDDENYTLTDNAEGKTDEAKTGGSKKKPRTSSDYELPKIPFSTSTGTVSLTSSDSTTLDKKEKDAEMETPSSLVKVDNTGVNEGSLSCQLVHKFNASAAQRKSEKDSSSEEKEKQETKDEEVIMLDESVNGTPDRSEDAKHEIDTNVKLTTETSTSSTKAEQPQAKVDEVIVVDCTQESPIVSKEPTKRRMDTVEENETAAEPISSSIDSEKQGQAAGGIAVGPDQNREGNASKGDARAGDEMHKMTEAKSENKSSKATNQSDPEEVEVKVAKATDSNIVVIDSDSESQGEASMDIGAQQHVEKKEAEVVGGNNKGSIKLVEPTDDIASSTSEKVEERSAVNEDDEDKTTTEAVLAIDAHQVAINTPSKESKSHGSEVSGSNHGNTGASNDLDKKKETEEKAMTTELSEISPENEALFKKHQGLKEKYSCRVNNLINTCRTGLQDEDFAITIPSTDGLVPSTEDGNESDKFPDFALSHLAAAIEGSNLPLSKLVTQTCNKLNEAFGISSFSSDCVLSKIKVLADRKYYVKQPYIGAGMRLLKASQIDVFQDENQDLMWRWEVISPDLLPQAFVARVKKARTSRKKISTQINAITKLLQSLEESINLLKTPSEQKSKLDKVLVKISQEEERVLKYEREAEKARLALEAKKKKEQDKEKKIREAKDQEEEKERLAEERKKEKQRIAEMKKQEKQRALEEKKKEKERKKQEADLLKQKKVLEREEQRRKEQETRQAALNKQKACMMTFFSSSAAKKKPNNSVLPVSSSKDQESCRQKTTFDVDKFRASINSQNDITAKGPLFSSLSARATASRRRRSRRVTLSVFVTVIPSETDPFGIQPYAEERDIEVLNKYKFFQFHEDCRPPYHGTWSKTSSIVSGKNPFGKDTTHLDYDVDSEAEWEEGDDEVGFDVNEDAADDEDENIDDEGDPQQYNYQDDWLAADDDLGSEEDVDEETKILRKKKLQNSSDGEKTRRYGQVPVCIIAPGYLGVPLDSVAPNANANSLSASNGRVEGFGVEDAQNLLSSHTGEVLCDARVFLDAFPPPLVEEDPSGCNPSSSGNQGAGRSINPVSQDDLKTLAKFIHHCTLTSRPKVVEEFKRKHPTVNISSNNCYRTLDTIAEKKRHPENGEYYWEVKTSDLDDLGLADLKAKTFQPNPDVDFTNGQNMLKGDILKTFVKFLHHSTYNSKEKLVGEFQSAHSALASNRSLVVRTLQAIAEKKKQLNDNGFYWEVKKEHLIELGLEELVKPFPEVTKDCPKESDKGNPTDGTNVVNGAPADCSLKKNQPVANTSGNKRKRATVSAASAASANLLAAFLTKKKASSRKA